MSPCEGLGDGKRQQQQQREGLLPTVFQVDTSLGPSVDTSEARRTILSTTVTLFACFGVHISLLRALVEGVRRTRETRKCA